MSKAFTREENEGPELPDLTRLISTLPAGAKNYMTADGARRLRQELSQLIEAERPQLSALSDDPDAKRQLHALDHRIYQLDQSLQTAESGATGRRFHERYPVWATVTITDTAKKNRELSHRRRG